MPKSAVPGFLSGFQLKSIPSTWLDPEDHTSTVFQVGCLCHAWFMTLFGEQADDSDSSLDVVWPAYAQCSGCGREALLFDPRIHGYNGHLGLATASAVGNGVRRPFAADTCLVVNREIAVQLRWEVADGIDHFHWITVYALCEDRWKPIIDCECS